MLSAVSHSNNIYENACNITSTTCNYVSNQNEKQDCMYAHDSPVAQSFFRCGSEEVGVGESQFLTSNASLYSDSGAEVGPRFIDKGGVSGRTAEVSLSSDSNIGGSSFLEMYQEVFLSGMPNYSGCRIPVPSALNVDRWNELLESYHDQIVADFVRYGWPIGAYGQVPCSVGVVRNHLGARQFPQHVDRYLAKEVSMGATLGPFDHNPLEGELHLSPLNTVPKRDSVDRRVIVDLSYPQGKSVNDAIDKLIYEGEEVDLQYPSVDDLAAAIQLHGKGCLIYKRDLSRAYRQIPVCPGDIRHLGFQWQGNIYIDRVLPFGLRSAAMICQRVSSAIAYIVNTRGFQIVNYLDDFAGAQITGKAVDAFVTLGEVLSELGVKEASEKAFAPNTNMEFLGVEFDTVELEMRVTPARLAEAAQITKLWLSKKSTTRKELESLLGKLLFISKCVRPGRLFVARLLEFLRSVPKGRRRVTIPCEIKRDIKWWDEFLASYNGVSIMGDLNWSSPDSVFASDACLSGAGACSSEEYWHTEFPSEVLSLETHINVLELWAVTVAAKIWSAQWKGLRIQILCDNSATVSVINSGRCKDKLMLKILRELLYIAAVGEFEVRAEHIPGVLNRIPDNLSRWHLDQKHVEAFRNCPIGSKLTEVQVPADAFSFVHSW